MNNPQDKVLLRAAERQARLETAQAELDSWKQHPQTQLFRNALRKWQEGIKEQWASGQFSSLDFNSSALANHKAISEHQIIQQILDLDAEQIEGMFTNDDEE